MIIKMILDRITRYLKGTTVLRAPDASAGCLICGLRKLGINCVIDRTEDGITTTLPSREAKKLLSLPEIENLPLTVTPKGLPVLLRRYRRRPGLIAGLVIFFVLLRVSGLFVWNITVTGNDRLGDAEILAVLEDHGFEIGTYIPAVDLYDLCNVCVLDYDEISWISVNLSGTTAEVQVIERLQPDRSHENNGTPADLVAARDGYIKRIELREGTKKVKVGETVEKGQLLVSGTHEVDFNGTVTMYVERADAGIFAETVRTFTETVPLTVTEKVPLDRKSGDITIKFFSKSVKITKNSGILPAKCDRIVDVKRWILFEDSGWLPPVALPVFIEKTEYREYAESTRRLTEEEAQNIALSMLAEDCEKEIPGAELLGRDVFFEKKDDSIILHATITCIEDIAEPRAIGEIIPPAPLP